MTGSIAGSLARRDLAALLVALAGLVAISWWLLSRIAVGMGGMDEAVGISRWAPADFLVMFGMWMVMMVGMMVPTATRSVLIFTQISARMAARDRAFVSGYWFVAGYLLVWAGFSAAATLLQWTLGQFALLSDAMVVSSPKLGSCLLIAAGIWQLSPIKDACLSHCRSPLAFLAGNFRPGKLAATYLGTRHGMYCLGCCWLLMGFLFIGGVMNLLWIAAIAGFVLVEKLLPVGALSTRITGAGMILAGIGYLVLA
ncbi:MAG: DUF2182 domain-containing protein [Hyphomicrobiales bacterium]